MKLSVYTALSALLITAAGCSEKNDPQPPATVTTVSAFASLNALDANGVPTAEEIGTASFTEEEGIVTLEIMLEGMNPGSVHAAHLHAGSCENPGMHWNANTSDPYCTVNSIGEAWGRPYLGDIGNIEIDALGKGSLSLQTDLWSLGDGSAQDIENLSLVIHQYRTDFEQECDPTHGQHPHTNPKIACGSVAILSEE